MASIGSTPSLVVGIAAGAAASAALEPALEIPKQQAWASAPNRLPDVGLVARLVATGQVTQANGQAMAARLGFDAPTLDSLTYLAQQTPSFAETLNLWRRFSLGDLPAGAFPVALVDHALAHEGLDWDYAPYLKQLKTANLVGLGDIATAVVRGALPSPPYMPVSPPTTGLTVPRFPQVPLDPEALAGALGYSPEQLQLMVARSGLSIAPIFAANAYFRGLINDQDYLLAIAEGDLRTEWAQTLQDAARQILTADQAMEGVLRGWWSKQKGYALAGRHGMTQADADALYQIRRRPMTVANITKAIARGGTFDPTNAPFPDPYDSSVHEADLGPEWYDLQKHLKYTYPSAFVIRSLLSDGAITATQAEQIFLYEGYEPSLAKTIAQHYAGTSSTGADPHVAKAQTQLWTTTHTAYKSAEIDKTEATANLTLLGIDPASQAQIMTLWDAELATFRKQMTPAQIKKAYVEGVPNPATGAAWNVTDALAALIGRGYSPNDAHTFLSL